MKIQYNIKINNLAWLKLGIVSLGFADLYPVILVVLWTPQLASFFPNPYIFKSALIIHVDLSVLIWLLSITATIWGTKSSLQATTGIVTLLGNRHCEEVILITDAAISRNNIKIPEITSSKLTVFPRNDVYPKLAFLATFLIAISPIAGLGLSLFAVTLLLYAINVLYFFDWANWGSLVNFTILSTIIIYALTWVCCCCSYYGLQNIIQMIPIEIEFYYELLFWSGGHLLQFIYTQILIFIWIVLFEKLRGGELKFHKFYLFLLYLNFIFSALILVRHISYDIIDGCFKEFYTNHIKYLGRIAPILCLVGMAVELLSSGLTTVSILLDSVVKRRGDRMTKTILLCSITLFLLSGLIAMNISGINVMISAHYHGSIVGISIACMGYCYLSVAGYQRHCKNCKECGNLMR